VGDLEKEHERLGDRYLALMKLNGVSHLAPVVCWSTWLGASQGRSVAIVYWEEGEELVEAETGLADVVAARVLSRISGRN
jgi:hypothetical protein